MSDAGEERTDTASRPIRAEPAVGALQRLRGQGEFLGGDLYDEHLRESGLD